jgi:spore maturation protein CgeB
VKLAELVSESKPDFVLILKGEVFKPETLKKIHPCVLWNFDSWYANDPSLLAQAQAVDFFLTPSGGLVEEYRKQGINAHWLPEAADPELHRPIYDAEKTVDVSVIGTVAGVEGRDEWLAKVGKWCDEKGKLLRIFGSFPGKLSEKWHTQFRAGPPFLQGTTEDEAHNIIVAYSKIVLDRTRTPDIEGAISARVYRTLAARGFLLMRHVKGLEKSFNPGWDLLTYRDDEECVKLIEQSLGETVNPFDGTRTTHDTERKVVGRHGWETVMAKHKWTDRVQELLKMI